MPRTARLPKHRSTKRLTGFFLLSWYLVAAGSITAQEQGRLLSDIRTPGGDVLEARWSPDGQYLAYLMDRGYDGTLELFLTPVGGSIDGGALLAAGEGNAAFHRFEFLFSPDSGTLLFSVPTADGDLLWSVPVDGGAPVELNQNLPGRSVSQFVVTPDSQTVVFVTSPLALRIYATPIGGGALTQLNMGFAGTGRILYEMWPTADNSRIVYTADLDIPFQEGLYSAPLDGGPYVQLHIDLNNIDRVTDVDLSPDGSRVLYNTRDRSLYTVPADGSSQATLVTHLAFQGFINEAGDRIYYGRTDGGFEFLHQPIAGGPPELITSSAFGGGGWRLAPKTENILARAGDHQQLRSILTATGANHPFHTNLPPGSAIGAGFTFNRDESHALFQVAPATIFGFFNSPVFDLYAAPLTGGSSVALNDLEAPPVHRFGAAAQDRVVLLASGRVASVPTTGGSETLLNDPLVFGGELFDMELSPDGERVAYIGRQDSSGAEELFETSVVGSSPIKLSAPLSTYIGEVRSFQVDPNGLYAVYLADQETYEHPELWSVNLEDGTLVKLNPPLPIDSTVQPNFTFAAAGQRVLFTTGNEEGVDLWSVSVGGGDAERLSPETLPLPANFSPFEEEPTFVAVPGGQWAVFYSPPSLYRVPLAGGPATQIAEGNDEIRGLDVTPDGTRILYSTFDPNSSVTSEGVRSETLLSISISGGSELVLGPPLDCTFARMRFSADSRFVASLCETDPDFGTDTVLLAGPKTGIELYMGSGNIEYEELQFTADSQYLLFTRSRQLYSHPLTVGSDITLVSDDSRAYEAANGRVFVHEPGELIAIDPDGTDRIVLTDPSFPIRELRISDDGLRALFGTADFGEQVLDLFHVSTQGGGEVRPVQGAEDVEASFALTPDGQEVLFARGDQLYIQSLASPEARPLVPEDFQPKIESPLQLTSGRVLYPGRTHPFLLELFSSELDTLFLDDFESGDTAAWFFTTP